MAAGELIALAESEGEDEYLRRLNLMCSRYGLPSDQDLDPFIINGVNERDFDVNKHGEVSALTARGRELLRMHGTRKLIEGQGLLPGTPGFDLR